MGRVCAVCVHDGERQLLKGGRALCRCLREYKRAVFVYAKGCAVDEARFGEE